eukprot:g2581.t1
MSDGLKIVTIYRTAEAEGAGPRIPNPIKVDLRLVAEFVGRKIEHLAVKDAVLWICKKLGLKSEETHCIGIYLGTSADCIFHKLPLPPSAKFSSTIVKKGSLFIGLLAEPIIESSSLGLIKLAHQQALALIRSDLHMFSPSQYARLLAEHVYAVYGRSSSSPRSVAFMKSFLDAGALGDLRSYRNHAIEASALEIYESIDSGGRDTRVCLLESLQNWGIPLAPCTFFATRNSKGEGEDGASGKVRVSCERLGLHIERREWHANDLAPQFVSELEVRYAVIQLFEIDSERNGIRVSWRGGNVFHMFVESRETMDAVFCIIDANLQRVRQKAFLHEKQVSDAKSFANLEKMERSSAPSEPVPVSRLMKISRSASLDILKVECQYFENKKFAIVHDRVTSRVGFHQYEDGPAFTSNFREKLAFLIASSKTFTELPDTLEENFYSPDRAEAKIQANLSSVMLNNVLTMRILGSLQDWALDHVARSRSIRWDSLDGARATLSTTHDIIRFKDTTPQYWTGFIKDHERFGCVLKDAGITYCVDLTHARCFVVTADDVEKLSRGIVVCSSAMILQGEHPQSLVLTANISSEVSTLTALISAPLHQGKATPSVLKARYTALKTAVAVIEGGAKDCEAPAAQEAAISSTGSFKKSKSRRRRSFLEIMDTSSAPAKSQTHGKQGRRRSLALAPASASVPTNVTVVTRAKSSALPPPPSSSQGAVRKTFSGQGLKGSESGSPSIVPPPKPTAAADAMRKCRRRSFANSQFSAEKVAAPQDNIYIESRESPVRDVVALPSPSAAAAAMKRRKKRASVTIASLRSKDDERKKEEVAEDKMKKNNHTVAGRQRRRSVMDLLVSKPGPAVNQGSTAKTNGKGRRRSLIISPSRYE